MARSSIEFFRAAIAECTAAAQTVHDSAIRQAYLDLAQGWQALADEIERLRSQILRPKIYSGRALPQRSLDDFYELRTANSEQRGRKHAIEHPTLGGGRNAAATGAKASLPHGRAERRRRADSP